MTTETVTSRGWGGMNDAEVRNLQMNTVAYVPAEESAGLVSPVLLI